MGPTIPGLEHAISSNEAFHLPELPRRIVVQGGGYIAVEFACIFAGLGSEVTLVYRGENILRGFDDDVREHLRNEMQSRGITVTCGHTVTEIQKTGGEFVARLSDKSTIRCDNVMFAIGRRPNVTGFGLERLGIKISNRGGIEVDEFSRTSIPNIYAVGDVTNRVNLTPVAIREGHAFADTVFGNRPTPVDHTNVPTAVFSEPEVGVIGLTEVQARERLAKLDVYKTTFRPMKATLSGRNTRSFMKLLVDASTDRVVGCHIVGPDAGELIQIVGIAVKMGATKADFDATMAVHPTAAEELVTMREKAMSYGQRAAE
jgi:glutathione reductase (NADPH)